jgi:hypothetical protein
MLKISQNKWKTVCPPGNELNFTNDLTHANIQGRNIIQEIKKTKKNAQNSYLGKQNN